VSADAGTAILDIGTTDESEHFTALEGAVEGIPGSQGGFHVNVVYQLPEGGIGLITVEHRVRRAKDGRLVSQGSRQFDLGLHRVTPWRADAPIPVFMCPTPVGVSILDELLVFTATVKDNTSQIIAAGSATAVFRCGTAGTSFCESICKG
jgi:hypothetical protein